MGATKAFHISEMLSVTSGVLLCNVGGVYQLVDHVTGMPHMTHQLPRACEVVGPELVRQMPWLANIPVKEFSNPEEVSPYISELAAKYGEWHPVAPLPYGAYVGRDPIAELVEMAPHLGITAVTLTVEYDG